MRASTSLGFRDSGDWLMPWNDTQIETGWPVGSDRWSGGRAWTVRLPGAYHAFVIRLARSQGSIVGKPRHIEVYRELEIGFDATLRDVACGTLEKIASETAWHRTTEVEESIEANYPMEVHGVLAFEREA